VPKRRGHGGGTVTRRPDGRWQVAVTVGVDARGRQKRKYAYARTKAEAERKLLELLVKYGAGQAADPGRVTLAEHLERWLAYKESRVKPTTLAGYTNLVRNHIVPEIGQVRLARLNAYHVEQLYQAMLARGLSARMVNLAHVVLNNALGLAVRWGTLDRNPAAAVDPPRSTPTEPSYWTPEQAVAFLEAARGHRLYALFYLALVTGMRRGLTWSAGCCRSSATLRWPAGAWCSRRRRAHVPAADFTSPARRRPYSESTTGARPKSGSARAACGARTARPGSSPARWGPTPCPGTSTGPSTPGERRLS